MMHLYLTTVYKYPILSYYIIIYKLNSMIYKYIK